VEYDFQVRLQQEFPGTCTMICLSIIPELLTSQKTSTIFSESVENQEWIHLKNYGKQISVSKLIFAVIAGFFKI
jgi:hypothetical protein